MSGLGPDQIHVSFQPSGCVSKLSRGVRGVSCSMLCPDKGYMLKNGCYLGRRVNTYRVPASRSKARQAFLPSLMSLSIQPL